MDQASITQVITTMFDGVDVVVGSREAGSPEISWGDTFFICDPDRSLEASQRFPFATIVTKDYGDFDNASNLDRPGVFRLNVGVSRETFRSLFAAHHEYDFAALDQLMPHPVYGRNHWVCVVNPSEATVERLKPLLAEAYDRAVRRYRKLRASGEAR